MVILHGAWLEGRIHFWAEFPPTPLHACDTALPRAPGDPDAPALLGALAAAVAGVAVSARARHARAFLAWLPTTAAGVPCPSHATLHPSSSADEPAAGLSPWQVTALPLSWGELGDLLGACAASRRLGPGLLAGNDLAAWSALWRFAGALVARQAHLPGLHARPDGDGFESCWTPLLAGADLARLHALARPLPPAACCLRPPDGAPDLPPAITPAAAARAFVEEAVDHLVRAAAVTPLSRAHALKGHFTSAHAAWLASLRGDGRRIHWPKPDELAALAASVESWRRPIDLGATTGCRLLFELCEPPPAAATTATAGWRLRHLLQSVAATPTEGEDSLLSMDWQSDQAPADIREFALTALGQATAICPLLDTPDGSLPPEGIPLDTGQAHSFLSLYAPLLTAAGFGVRTPEWWSADERRPRLRLLARPRGTSTARPALLGLDDLVQVNWAVALGDHAITLRELDALAASAAPLVRWHGRWIEVDAARLRQAARLWRRRRAEPMAVRDLLRLAIGADVDAHGIGVGGVTAEGAVNDLLQRLRGDAQLETPPIPETFHGTLRPYQVRGFAWLAFLRQWGLGACLADDMGLGKTIQALTLFAHDRARNDPRPVLLACPMSLIGNWQREAARFTPSLRVLAHHGPARALGRALAEAAASQDLVITSYHLLHRDFDALQRVPWSGLVLDEAQNIKNPETRQSRAARALRADYRLALTGTPVENQVGDLWALMDFLNPGLLGSHAAFRNRFQRPIQTGIDSGARATLRQIAAPFILRRLKSDPSVIADLPARIENKIFCPLTREQAALYAAELQALDAALDDASGLARRGLVLATLTRLKQICNHPAHFLGDGSPLAARSGKLARLEAMIDEVVRAGDRALIFTQFAVMGRLLSDHLSNLLGDDLPFLHGGLSRAAREAAVARFQAADGPPLFVLSLKAGGTGLNLTRANHVFHFDRWWNPAVENQATDRAHRIGQTRQVFVHKFVCAGTLEERIDAMITSKLSLAADLIGTGESWLTELSNAQLRETLALAADAVAEEEP